MPTGRMASAGVMDGLCSTVYHRHRRIGLDMYDPATKQLVRTGRASKTLDPARTRTRSKESR